MKRHRGNRADPVSCQSCRSKKLKCNRAQPCSNCTARGISCSFLVPPQEPADATSTHRANAELIERVQILESTVLKLKQAGSVEPTSSHSGDKTQQQDSIGASWETVFASAVHHDLDLDSQVLENVGTRDDSILPQLSSGLVFRTKHATEIRKKYGSNPHAGIDWSSGTVVTFPNYKAATLLFQSYESTVDHLCRILHIPTTRSLMKTFYLRISQGQSVAPGQAALLLSIFAVAAYFYPLVESSEVAATREDAIQLSKILSESALDVLNHSSRNTSGTLEDIQASILMSFVVYHLDGFSARGRLLSAAATSMARELRLHRLDSESEMSCAENISARSLIEREVKRRVFWQIASTDWLFAYMSGPQEGTYFIQPGFSVKLPRDCSDDDLVFDEALEPSASPQPTGMAFFLERVRLAHLCREMTDTVPLETEKLLQMPYEHIVSLDKKLQTFISELPYFFRLDAPSCKKSKLVETMHPAIYVSRYCINAEVHSRRCKLHQKFLLRQSSNRRYAYSRQACLESARTVIRGYEHFRQYDSLSTVPELMGMSVHFTHLALVVMVMDLCFNKNEADEASIKAEVKAALQMFENARNESLLISRFFGSLKEFLQKHTVQLSSSTMLTTNTSARVAREVVPDALEHHGPDHAMQHARLETDMQSSETMFDDSFDDFWQIALQGETNPDSIIWDNLFSDLDSRPL